MGNSLSRYNELHQREDPVLEPETWEISSLTRWINGGCDPEKIHTVNKVFLNGLMLRQLPPQLGQLINVQELYVSIDRLYSVVNEITNLVNLKSLFLSYNYIQNLPYEIRQLTQLEELNLYCNSLEDVTHIGSLTQLKFLTLAQNNLIHLSHEICNLTQLTHLDISENHITDLPEDIGNLTNLETLLVDGNRISKLPPSLKNLKKLDKIVLNCNMFTEFPDEIFALTSLTQLYLSYNFITEIPTNIRLLIHLKELYIAENKLTTLPVELSFIKGMKEINYRDNPILYVPPNLLRMIEQKRYINGTSTYQDRQNVHAPSIQESFRTSVFKLLQTPGIQKEELLGFIRQNNILTKFTKTQLIEYCESDEIHETLQITFCELAQIVVKRIMEHQHHTEILEILNKEMIDSIGMCFTGRMTRLVNCLSGYDSDVNLTINEKEQISNIIITLKATLKGKNEYTSERHKALSEIELKGHGFSDEIIKEWLNDI